MHTSIINILIAQAQNGNYDLLSKIVNNVDSRVLLQSLPIDMKAQMILENNLPLYVVTTTTLDGTNSVDISEFEFDGIMIYNECVEESLRNPQISNVVLETATATGFGEGSKLQFTIDEDSVIYEKKCN